MITDTEIGILRDTLDRLGPGPALVHTSLIPLGLKPTGKRRWQGPLDEHWSLLYRVCGGRETLLPAFNYDFYTTRHFDVQNDGCGIVGELNEHIRKDRAYSRTHTPVYSVCSAATVYLPTRSIALAPTSTPLGHGSVFHYLVRERGLVVFWGAAFSSNTFLHYVEELAQVGYRYPKHFPGIVYGYGGARRTHVNISHRVRPPGDVVEIDWARLEQDLIDNELLVTAALGRGKMRAFRADRVREYWIRRLQDEESYFLTRESCVRVAELAQRIGYPFTLEGVEG